MLVAVRDSVQESGSDLDLTKKGRQQAEARHRSIKQERASEATCSLFSGYVIGFCLVATGRPCSITEAAAQKSSARAPVRGLADRAWIQRAEALSDTLRAYSEIISTWRQALTRVDDTRCM